MCEQYAMNVMSMCMHKRCACMHDGGHIYKAARVHYICGYKCGCAAIAVGGASTDEARSQ
jgi:hypothetical protein